MRQGYLKRRDAEGAEVEENEVSQKIIGACIEVHRVLGPGLLESVYQNCLAKELSSMKVSFQKEVPKPVDYKGTLMDCGFRLDFIVEDKVIVELKAVEKIHPVHKVQVLTYLKITGCKLGLLINFNTPVLKDGIERIVLNL